MSRGTMAAPTNKYEIRRVNRRTTDDASPRSYRTTKTALKAVYRTGSPYSRYCTIVRVERVQKAHRNAHSLCTPANERAHLFATVLTIRMRV